MISHVMTAQRYVTVKRDVIRLMAAITLIAALSMTFVMCTQTAASARAEVISSSPANGATVREAPDEVFIRFNEKVSLSFGGLTVVDEKGDPVDEGKSGHGVTEDIVRVGLIDGLGPGTYVANYRVASQDGQPVTGAILFTVGTDTGADETTGGSINDTTVLDRQKTANKSLHIAAGVFRFITYIGALLSAGLAAFLAFIHDQRSDRWKLAPPVRIGSLVAAFGAVGTVFMETALLSGRGLAGAGNISVMRDVLGDGLGWATAVLLVGLALVHLSTDTNRLVVAQTLSFYGALMVTASFSLSGHSYTASNQSVAIIGNAIHVTTAAIWLGGLVGIAAILTIRQRSRSGEASDTAGTDTLRTGTSTTGMARIIKRFSTVAAISLLALTVSGAVLASTQLSGPSALASSTYGRVLGIKVAVVVVVCLLAAYNRFKLVPAILKPAPIPEDRGLSAEGSNDGGEQVDKVRLDEEPHYADSVDDGAAWKRMISIVRLEAIGLVMALAITSALVAIDAPQPPRQTGPQIFNEWADLSRGGKVTMNINPSRVGYNTIHIQYYDPSGRPDRNVTDAQIEFLLPQNGIGPIERKALRGGNGHFIYQGTELSIAGEWQVNVLGQITQFDQERTYFEVNVSD